MALFTKDELDAMADNGRRALDGEEIDPVPQVLLGLPDGKQRWLLTEIYPYDPDIAYGLCDLGIGMPELGEVRISELEAMTGAARMTVERMTYRPTPDMPISRLTHLAGEAGKIVF